MLTRRLAKPMGPRCSRQVASHASHQLIRVMHTGGARSTHRRLPLGVAVHPACASRAVREAAAAGKVGEVIRLVRRAHGPSQRQLGATTGRSQSTISRIERGGPGTRDVATLRQLGSELDIARYCSAWPSTRTRTNTAQEPASPRCTDEILSSELPHSVGQPWAGWHRPCGNCSRRRGDGGYRARHRRPVELPGHGRRRQ